MHVSDRGTDLALTLGGPLERAGIWGSGDLGSRIGSTHLGHVALFSSHLVSCPVSALRPSIRRRPILCIVPSLLSTQIPKPRLLPPASACGGPGAVCQRAADTQLLASRAWRSRQEGLALRRGERGGRKRDPGHPRPFQPGSVPTHLPPQVP